MLPKVSIIIPVFNVEDYLEECLDSILAQTLEEIEILLTVDESSSDSSLEIARKYEKDYKDKVKLLVHPRGVPGDSRNYGLDVANGEYIGFVDSDDMISMNMFEELYLKAKENDAEVVCCDIEYIYPSGRSYIRHINAKSGINVEDDPNILKESTCYVWNKIFRKELIDKYSFRFPKGRWYEDSSLIYNVLAAANKIELIDKPLYQYKSQRDGATAHTIDKRIFDVVFACKDIVTFFKKQGKFTEKWKQPLYELCKMHIDVRFNNLATNSDKQFKSDFINNVFDFYDEFFPERAEYKSTVLKESKLDIAKEDRAFALSFFNTSSKGVFKKKANYRINQVAFYLKCLDKKIVENAILYESYEGAGMNCNSYALFLSIISDERFKGYRHIWSVANENIAYQLKRTFTGECDIKFVVRGSDEFFEALATSKYLINNNTFPGYFTKRKEQVYITSWHAITVKTLGYDYEAGKIDSWNQVRNYLATDWFIAANDFMANNLKTAYKMQSIFEGKIITEGYPRNDFFIGTEKKDVCAELEKSNIHINMNKKIVLYAPTWKGAKVSNPDIDMDGLINDIKKLESLIDTDKYQVLVKPHHVVYRALSASEKASGKYIPATIETNRLLSMVDVLISDYSSIFIDFMCTKRPVLFYLPDYEEYQDYRGIYFGLDELPGPIATDMGQMAGYINSIDDVNSEYHAKYSAFYDQMYGKFGGKNVSEKVIDCILKNNVQNYDVKELKDEKIKVLIYPGTLYNRDAQNHVTEILNCINYDLFDVTMVANWHTHPEVGAFLLGINENVRLLCIGISPPKLGDEKVSVSYFCGMNLKKRRIAKKKKIKHYYEREFRRRFGNAKFDVTINLEPTNRDYFTLLSFAKDAVQFVWPKVNLNEKTINEIFDNGFRDNCKYDHFYITEPHISKMLPDNVVQLPVEYFINKNLYERDVRVSENKDGKLYVMDLHTYTGEWDDSLKIPALENDKFKLFAFTDCKKGGLSDKVIHAFKIIAKERDDVVLYVVAEGDQFVRFKNLIEKQELTDRIRFVDTTSKTLINSFVHFADCIIETPDSSNYLSMKRIRLAQSFSKPVITTVDIFGNQLNTIHGIYVAKHGVVDIYMEMKKVLEDRNKNRYSFDNYEFSVQQHNNEINKRLYDAVKNPNLRQINKKDRIRKFFNKKISINRKRIKKAIAIIKN